MTSYFNYHFIQFILFGAIGAIIGAAVLIILKMKDRLSDLKKGVLFVLLIAYLSALLSQTLIPPQFFSGDFSLSAFHRPILSDFNLNLKFLLIVTDKWYMTHRFYYVFEEYFANIIIFIPMGLLLPTLNKNLKRTAIPIGLAVSTFIELYQLCIDRQPDLTDIVLNTVGTVIGYLLYVIAINIHNKLRKKHQT